MSLFEDTAGPLAPDERARRRPRDRFTAVPFGVWALAVALVALLILTFLPTGFVIQRQGPVVNTLGTAENADGEDVPLISVDGAETYPTGGALDLTTVQIQGNREQTPSWFQLALAWFDPAEAVLPLDRIFPAGTTTEERNQESAALMVDSQKEATAAALAELGYDVRPHVSVYGFAEDSPAEGILEEGDEIVSADGRAIETTEQLRAAIGALEGAPIDLVVRRDGDERTETVTPVQQDSADGPVWLIGVTTAHDYDFPIDVTIQLDRIGGPSAGQMFALGIIDTLTPGELNGGENVAGTGTIDASGAIGPIGGIRQKLYGARDAGADWFLAPADNCDEVVGHVPGDLRVVSVETLDDSLAALEAISTGDKLADLPSCSAG
ncbi:PDZ domain-containing protein [Microbacterium sp. EYE_5]|uniref:YlbL family protein n=1 Tax=unclassified Microbacterium TaxID=2609290 RepID=UPI0027DF6B6D|nr:MULTISPECIES: S16 family serine protease [unclassified Microbacterium]MCK6081015.1 PDZ domain-containing protein [Microbacterium sp. EYE_382]MCK6086285.1 PDZ domain-containing protein [Microbacterium sp. EYE_384]MCK6124217.1 PDZ domain-containing protein [Microbacterium sp. EYE_80]MCK6127126.1 PDZ domain-containing protein [Microbacterium sp. EYE_79]MCK6141970.1 PDZ domain-containing protein [Microbacterium sp. EYE_39]